MQLNNLVIDASPKTSWQCFDLGCRVALVNYKTLFFYWILLTTPIFLLFITLDIQWGLFAFWLFKPWYERGLLYILSRTVFGTNVSIKQTLLALPSQIKPLWFSSITFRRLSPSRSFDMAVTQLENLSTERRSKRLRVLHKSNDDNNSWWTICCVHWESFLAFAIITVIQILLPTEFDYGLFIDAMSNAESLENYVFAICMFVGIALVAPFYVAGGFIAYLNRRVILEGWDIELGFAKWRLSYLEKASKTGFIEQSSVNSQKANSAYPIDKLSIIFVCLLSLGFLSTDNAYAQTTQVPSEEIVDPEQEDSFHTQKQEIREDLDRVLEEPPFSQSEIVTRYRWKASTDEVDKKEDKGTNSFSRLLADIAKFMASSFEILLWIMFIFVFGYIIHRNWANITGVFTTKSTKIDNAPLPSFISTAFKEELPDDIVQFVQQAIESEEFRRALSILVRASFTYLSKEQHIRITNSMTENECLQEINNSCPEPIYLYMQSLLQQWMKMAWAHQLPNAETLHILKQGYSDNFIVEQYFSVPTSSPRDENKQSGSQQ